MAMEQVEARSDIWALGVVLYEMVTDVRPFAPCFTGNAAPMANNRCYAPTGAISRLSRE